MSVPVPEFPPHDEAVAILPTLERIARRESGRYRRLLNQATAMGEFYGSHPDFWPQPAQRRFDRLWVAVNEARISRESALQALTYVGLEVETGQ